MFLFTTPSPSTPRPSSQTPVLDAIRQGANATGTDFDYLMRTARRESALDPSANAPTSSATGLFQFIEQTWLGLVRSDGERLGLSEEAKAVTSAPGGGFTVADPEARQAILDLRKDPHLASVMAGALTRQNRDALASATGREPSAGELYMAHVLGARGAPDLIATARADPARPAAADFPDAARANRSTFYKAAGQPRGAGEVYDVLASAQLGAQPGTQGAAGPVVAAADANGSAPMPVGARPPGLQGLFQTGIRTGPLSDAVARLWRANNDGSRAPGPAVAFFPRSNPIVLPDKPSEAPVALSPQGGPDQIPRPAPAPAPATAAAAASPAMETVVQPPARPMRLPPIRPSFGPAGARSVPGPDVLRASNVDLLAKGRRP